MTNYRSPSFDSRNGLFIVDAHPSYGIYFAKPADGVYGWAGADYGVWGKGVIEAIDYQTGKIRWEHEVGASGAGAGVLTTESGITITGDASVLPIAQYTAITNGAITLNTTTRTFSNLTNANGSSLTALAGGVLHLPSVTTYTNTSSSPVLEASGTGSILDLSAITSLTVSGSFDTDVTAEALAGGTVDLHNLTQILDPAPTGTVDRGAILKADGTGSTLNLSALATFQDTSGPNSLSTLSATNGGDVNAAASEITARRRIYKRTPHGVSGYTTRPEDS